MSIKNDSNNKLDIFDVKNTNTTFDKIKNDLPSITENIFDENIITDSDISKKLDILNKKIVNNDKSKEIQKELFDINEKIINIEQNVKKEDIKKELIKLNKKILNIENNINIEDTNNNIQDLNNKINLLSYDFHTKLKEHKESFKEKLNSLDINDKLDILERKIVFGDRSEEIKKELIKLNEKVLNIENSIDNNNTKNDLIKLNEEILNIEKIISKLNSKNELKQIHKKILYIETRINSLNILERFNDLNTKLSDIDKSEEFKSQLSHLSDKIVNIENNLNNLNFSDKFDELNNKISDINKSEEIKSQLSHLSDKIVKIEEFLYNLNFSEQFNNFNNNISDNYKESEEINLDLSILSDLNDNDTIEKNEDNIVDFEEFKNKKTNKNFSFKNALKKSKKTFPITESISFEDLERNSSEILYFTDVNSENVILNN